MDLTINKLNSLTLRLRHMEKEYEEFHTQRIKAIAANNLEGSQEFEAKCKQLIEESEGIKKQVASLSLIVKKAGKQVKKWQFNRGR